MRFALRVSLFVAMVGGVIAAGIAPVQAQAPSGATLQVERPFRLKIGGFFPTNRETKSQVGKNFFSFGGTWDFGRNPGPVPVFYSAYLDYASKGGNTTFKVGQTNVEYPTERGYLGLGVAMRNYLVPENSPYNPYVGGGIGIYQFRSKSPSQNGNNIESKGKTNTRFGGKFFTGVEMPQGYFGELDYTLPGDSTGNGLTLSIGYRF